jgi:hypothetical protein
VNEDLANALRHLEWAMTRDDALLWQALGALELAQANCIHGELAEPSPIFADAIDALRERLGERS